MILQVGEEQLRAEFVENQEESQRAVSFAGAGLSASCLARHSRLHARRSGWSSAKAGAEIKYTSSSCCCLGRRSVMPRAVLRAGFLCCAAVLLFLPLLIGFCVSRLLAEPAFHIYSEFSPEAFALSDRQKVRGSRLRSGKPAERGAAGALQVKRWMILKPQRVASQWGPVSKASWATLRTRLRLPQWAVLRHVTLCHGDKGQSQRATHPPTTARCDGTAPASIRTCGSSYWPWRTTCRKLFLNHPPQVEGAEMVHKEELRLQMDVAIGKFPPLTEDQLQGRLRKEAREVRDVRPACSPAPLPQGV